MAVHLLVTQLRFTRAELMRCLAGVGELEARRRFKPMNSISWIIGHLADQENRYWVKLAQGQLLFPELNALVGHGQPASTPPLDQVLHAWSAITAAADPYLDTLSPALLQTHLEWEGRVLPDRIGTMLQRNIYHYWFHLGEVYAIRQLLGHGNLPEFVGDMSGAPYHPEE